MGPSTSLKRALGRLPLTRSAGSLAVIALATAVAVPLGTAPAGAGTLAITSPGLPAATVGAPYSTTLTATGGTAPYTWAVVSGSVCPGLALDATSGAITGTATAVGTYPFTVQVTDSSSPSQTATANYVAVCQIPTSSTTSTQTLVSGGQNSLCVDPTGVTWVDGTAPAALLPAALSCNPPATLTGVTNAVPVTSVPGSWGSISGAGWVGIQANGSDSLNPPPGNELTNEIYVYDTEFSLPSCYSGASLSGQMLADNGAAAYVNDNLVVSHYQTTPGGGPYTNFAGPPTSLATSNAAFFHSGTNVVDFLVEDHSPPSTGLDFSLTVTYSTGQCGTLKICKVAGFMVKVGTPFTFSYTATSGSGTVTVPAGPAPGGYCVVAGTFLAGAFQTTEAIPPGDSVASITSDPPGGTNVLPAGLHNGTLAAGEVTEVTYTDQSLQGAQAGYLEVCKQVTPLPLLDPPATFAFTVDGQPVTVPTDACSPAIEVLAGTATVTETPVGPWAMTGCSTIPASALVTCNLGARTATVSISPGGIPDETILTVTDAAVPGVSGNPGTSGSS